MIVKRALMAQMFHGSSALYFKCKVFRDLSIINDGYIHCSNI